MPTIYFPDGTTEFYETEVERQQILSERRPEEAAAATPTPQVTAEKPEPEVATTSIRSVPEEEKEPERSPSWVEETIRTISTAFQQAPDQILSGLQAQSQSMPTSMLTGGDPMLAMMARSGGFKPEKIAERVTEEAEEAKLGARAASYGITVPDEKGEFQRFGIPEDVPVVGPLLSGEGKLNRAIRPKTKIGQNLADVGTAMVVAGALPGGSGALGANYATLRAAAKPGIKPTLGMAVALAKRVGADLPKDFLEELFVLGLPEPTQEQNEVIDNILAQTDPKVKSAMLEAILADNDETHQFYQRWLTNTMANTAASGVIRGHLGALNQTRRYARARKRVDGKPVPDLDIKEVEKINSPVLQRTQEIVETDRNNLLNHLQREELAELNKDFNAIIRGNMESLNTRANGLMTAEVAMRQAAEEGRLAATEGIEISQRVTAETKRLSKLIKDRSASIKELEKLERKTPGYISGTVKRRYNRYNKQLESYKADFQKIAGPVDDSYQQRASRSIAQFESLSSARLSGVDTFVNELDAWIDQIDNINARRLALKPDKDFSRDPYYQAFTRIKAANENYKALGGKNKASGSDIDAGLEASRRALEQRLLNTVQQEFGDLYENYGGKGPIPISEEFVDAAKRVAEGEPVEEVIKSAKKAPEAPKGEAKAEPATEQPEVDPWTMSKQTPLKTNAEGQVVPDPNATRQIGYTEGIPENSQARVRQAQVDLGLRSPDQVEAIVDDVQRFTSEDAVDDFLKYYEDLLKAEGASADALSDTWEKEATKSLARVIGGQHDTHSARKLALLEAFKRKGGKPANYTPKARERFYRLMGKYANLESDFMELHELLITQGIKRGKAIAGLEDAHVEVLTTAVELDINSSRLINVVSAMTDQADLLSPTELQTYRSIAAQEGLILLASLQDFITLRNRAGSLLAQFRGSALQDARETFQGLVRKKRAGEDPASYVENYIKDIQKTHEKLTEQIADQLPKHIGLKSNMEVVQESLEKFRNPDLVPDEDDVAIFNKIINQMTIAAVNPNKLTALTVSGHDVVHRTMLANGISKMQTQTSFIPQSATYSLSFWLADLTGGLLPRLTQNIPWLRDDEMFAVALQREREALVMLEHFTPKMAARIIRNAYMGRVFNRSVVTDAISPIDTRFRQSPDVRNPIREIQMLNIINNEEGISDRGVMGAFKRMFPEREESLKTGRNHLMGAFANLHDLAFYGDAYDLLDDSLIGKAAKVRNELSGPGIRARFVYPNIPGVNKAITPYESKLAGGEVMGASLPLKASEISTEFIGGGLAYLKAYSKAVIDIQDMVDGAGRPMYKKGTNAYQQAIEDRFLNTYMKPIEVGMGNKTEVIGHALNDADAQQLALATDMMMPMEDDVYGAMSERLKARGDDGKINFFLAGLMPYLRAPLNAHKHHFYYTQPIPGTPIPMGAAIEAGVFAKTKLQRMMLSNADADQLSNKILGFQSKLFDKDPKVRHQAISGLSLGSALNVGLISLVESNAIQVTGGQRYQYQEANNAYIPMYSIKIGDAWVPYRWIPYVGEMLSYITNLRDMRNQISNAEQQNVVGTLIMTTGATLMDTPALAGIDTLVSILEKPSEAEFFILDYMERVGGIRLASLRQGLLRANNEAYGARPVISGTGADIIARKQPQADPTKYSENLNYWEEWQQGFMDTLGLAGFFAKGGAIVSDRLGLRGAVETYDEFVRDLGFKTDRIEGDFRQAHWYKEGDIKYHGPGQASFMGTIFGRHWPAPDASNAVDVEMFRHGIKPPGQVFQSRFGIAGNDVMLNRFRRFLGTEYRDEMGRSTYQVFDDLVNNRIDIYGGTEGPFYKDLPDDPKNSLTFDAKTPLQIDVEGEITKRSILMEYRRDLIQDASEVFLRGAYEVEGDDGNMNIQPIKYAAPERAKQAYLEVMQMKSLDKLR